MGVQRLHKATILIALLTLAAPAYAAGAARNLQLHRRQALSLPAVRSDGVDLAAWQTAGDTIGIRDHDRERAMSPPPGSCGPDRIKAVGGGQILFWCGPQQLIVVAGASGSMVGVTPTGSISGPADGSEPTSWAVGRYWIRLTWPLSSERGNYQREVQWHTGTVRPSFADRSNWLNLGARDLLARPCVRGTGSRVVSQSGGYALLTRGSDFELVSCRQPRDSRSIIGDNAQLGGGWLTWRPYRSMTSLAALRLRDHKLFKVKLPAMANGSSANDVSIVVVHTRDRLFVADTLQRAPVLRTATLPSP